MLLSAANEEHKSNFAVLDSRNQQIPYVLSYDTETKEIELLVKVKDEVPKEDKPGESDAFVVCGEGGKPLALKFILPGSYAIDREGKKL